MTLHKRLLRALTVCVAVGLTEPLTASAADEKDLVEVVATPFFEGAPPDLFHHLGLANVACFRCKTSGKDYQVVGAIEIWADGKSTVSGYMGKEVYKQLSDVKPHDLRASVSLTRSAGETMTVRSIMTALDDGSASSIQPLHVGVPNELQGFKPVSLRDFTLRPGEERVVWAYSGTSGRRPGGIKWDFKMGVHPERNEEVIDVSGKEQAEFLVFMKMKLVSWLDD